eukprot:TRINITY_DN28188_c0_g1_i2.p1 TRINITY_DN28188_c0_g1~~TRINITY_DN28188_c0_g1_i2.p1  ORF type:complete len:167 (-),score=15.32 TRINITY_DN28188_c0_g1_i2:118-618(-)
MEPPCLSVACGIGTLQFAVCPECDKEEKRKRMLLYGSHDSSDVSWLHLIASGLGRVRELLLQGSEGTQLDCWSCRAHAERSPRLCCCRHYACEALLARLAVRFGLFEHECEAVGDLGSSTHKDPSGIIMSGCGLCLQGAQATTFCRVELQSRERVGRAQLEVVCSL